MLSYRRKLSIGILISGLALFALIILTDEQNPPVYSQPMNVLAPTPDGPTVLRVTNQCEHAMAQRIRIWLQGPIGYSLLDEDVTGDQHGWVIRRFSLPIDGEFTLLIQIEGSNTISGHKVRVNRTQPINYDIQYFCDHGRAKTEIIFSENNSALGIL
jgi:hypothetical protein